MHLTASPQQFQLLECLIHSSKLQCISSRWRLLHIPNRIRANTAAELANLGCSPQPPCYSIELTFDALLALL